MEMKKDKIIGYIAIIGSIILVAGLGSLFVNLGMEYFDSLERPSEFVPSFVIPIVWTVIYCIFAVVLCIIYSKQEFDFKTTILIAINGILNILWCLLFFTLESTLLGVISIVLLLISSYLLVIDLLKYKEWYAYLTVLYPIWVSCATCLNLSLWILN